MEIKDYPSNSHKSKQEAVEQTNVTAELETGRELKMREPSVGKKIFKTFVQEDLSDIAGVIVHDYIIPGIKEWLLASVEIALGGETPSRRSSGKHSSYNSYDKYYRSDRRDRRDDRDRRRDRREDDDAPIDLSDIVYDDRDMVEDIVFDLRHDIKKYDFLSVANFWDILKENGYKVKHSWRSYTDNDYGWYDMGALKVDRVRGGFIMHVPKTVSIKDED